MEEQTKKHQPFIMDAHLDLSMNAMEWNRDLRESVQTIRQREEGMTDKPDRGNGTVSLPALREGKFNTAFNRFKENSTQRPFYAIERSVSLLHRKLLFQVSVMPQFYISKRCESNFFILISNS